MLWATWAIFSQRSLKMREWANRSFFKKTYKKLFKNLQKYDLIQIFWENHCFLLANERMSDLLQKNERFACLLFYHEWLFCHERPEGFTHTLTVTLLSWVTWAIPSQLLICPEQIACSRSLKWAILSKWVNERIPNPGKVS